MAYCTLILEKNRLIRLTSTGTPTKPTMTNVAPARRRSMRALQTSLFRRVVSITMMRVGRALGPKAALV